MGFRINMSREDETAKPGTYYAEVLRYSEEHSKAGDAMLALDFKAVGGSYLVRDRLMLEGKGWGIARAKLIALGAPREGEIDIDALRLIGRRAYLALERREFNGQVSLQVDIRAEGSHCGYWPETEPPEDAIEPDPFEEPKPINPEETPF